MSEYQCYEFVAIERPLSDKEMAELRAISTRAEISPTRFWNEYQWGNLKADPAKLLERYFDAHCYFANWGTHTLMLRLPKSRVEVKTLKRYFTGSHSVRMIVAGQHVVLELSSDVEEPEYDEDSRGSLAALAPLRAELLGGDMRPAYLAWLLKVQEDAANGEEDTDETEPPVPPGLAALTGAQQAMVEFLRIDPDLLAAAAAGSRTDDVNEAELRRWVSRLSASQKEAWLLRAADERELPLGAELLRAFRAERTPAPENVGRTVGQLRSLAEAAQSKREQAQAARARKALDAAEKERRRHLDKLGRDVDAAWANLEEVVAGSDYDGAVRLAMDLRDLAAREGESPAFAARFAAMRERQSRRRGFFQRWNRANETPRQ